MLDALARIILWLTGWRIVGERPRERKFVLLAAPHTSNWDLLYLLAIARKLDIPISWMGKEVIFRPPFGKLMRWLGGIPVARGRRSNVVEQMARRFADSDTLVVVIPAEGTRSRVDYWKSGFYHIAHTAGVPIVFGYLDYGRKQAGLGPAYRTTGDVPGDMDRIRAFYAGVQGKHPERFGRIRLREEDASARADPAVHA